MLSNAPTTNDEFAKTTRVNSRSYHLMRLLVSMGIFSAEKNEEFPLNSMRELLLTGSSDSLRRKFWQMVLRSIMSGVIYSIVQTEKNLFYNTFKMIFDSYFKQNAEVAVTFK